MKERVVVSVSSIHGTKHFHLGKWFRHFLKGFGYVLVASILATGGVIYYLLDEVDFAKLKQQELESQSMSLTEEVTSLRMTCSNEKKRCRLFQTGSAILKKYWGWMKAERN
jgi:hypothetical protein